MNESQNASTLKSFRKQGTKLEFSEDSKEELNKFNQNINNLNSGIQSLDDKIRTSNDSRTDGIADINQNKDFSINVKNVEKSLDTLDSSINSFYKKLNQKIANDPEFDTPKINTIEVVSSKLKEPEAQEDPKIVSLLSSIYDEVRKNPEKQMLQQEQYIDIQNLIKEEISSNNTQNDKIHKVEQETKKAQTDSTNAKLDKLNKSIKTGFRKSLLFSDKISNFLFRYTITAALRFSKIVAAILALIVPLDILQLQIRKWFDGFDLSGFMSGLTETFNSIKQSLESIAEYLVPEESLSESFNSAVQKIGDNIAASYEVMKDQMAKDITQLKDVLIWSFDKLIGPIVNLGAEITYQMSKLSASLIGMLPGMGSKGDEVKIQGMEEYIKKGGTVNEKDMNILLEYRLQQLKKDDSMKAEYEDIKDLKKEEQIEILRKREEAQIKLNQIQYNLENRYLDKKVEADMENQLLQITSDVLGGREYTDINKLEIDTLSKISELRSKIEKTEEIKPVNEDKDLSTSIENINNTTNNTQIVNQVSKSKTVIQRTVQTSTHAPGMYGSLV